MGDPTARAYAVLGLGLSLGGAGLALTLTLGRAQRSFYASGVYYLTARSHRRFAAVSALFAAAFGLALRWPVLDVPLLAVYVLSLVFYVSSFARGFSGEDE
jgi:hypothetical protein